VACGFFGPASAQSASPQQPDPLIIASSPPASSNGAQQLPAFRGTVAYYTLTPRGDVDGLVLTDGTEVHLPPHLSTALVLAAKPGDAVTVRGLRAYSLPMIAAVTVTNDASGQTVVDTGPPGVPGRPGAASQPMSVQGRIKSALHGPGGEINGAVLDDATILRLPPPEAQRLVALLVPGQNVVAEGNGLTTPMGRVVEVRMLAQATAAPNSAHSPFAGPIPGTPPQP
jgi:hypothetical protein